MNEQDYCYDLKDERDYKYSEVFTVGAELPSNKILDNVEYQNQGIEEITRMMCVAYSVTHGNNEENFQEGSDVRISGKDLGLKMIDLGRLDPNKGALVSAGPRTARDEGYIKGWTLVNTIEEIKDSIVNKRPVVVGSNKINWTTGYKFPFVLGGNKGSGHAVLIIGYMDDYEGGCFIIKNSYGDEKYDKGKMYLPYKDLNLLFPSRYSLIDEEDLILSHKKKIMENINIPKAVEAFENGFWGGVRPTESASRQEVATMIQRVYEKLLEEINQK